MPRKWPKSRVKPKAKRPRKILQKRDLLGEPIPTVCLYCGQPIDTQGTKRFGRLSLERGSLAFHRCQIHLTTHTKNKDIFPPNPDI
jgi:hypothetical protein